MGFWGYLFFNNHGSLAPRFGCQSVPDILMPIVISSAIFHAASCVFGISLFLASLILRCTESTQLDIPMIVIYSIVSQAVSGINKYALSLGIEFQISVDCGCLAEWIFKIGCYILSSNMMLKHYPFSV